MRFILANLVLALLMATGFISPELLSVISLGQGERSRPSS